MNYEKKSETTEISDLKQNSPNELYAADNSNTIGDTRPNDFQTFMSSMKRYTTEYWIIILIAAFSLIAIFALQGTSLSYFQNSVGVLLAIWLPGYSFVRALFTSDTSPFTKHSISGYLLTASFSIVFSIILVALTGFALDLSPWGVTLQSLTLVLSLLTILFATVALQRRNKFRKNIQ